MPEKDSSGGLSCVKTGSIERRLSLTRAGIIAGTRLAGDIAACLFPPKNEGLSVVKTHYPVWFKSSEHFYIL